MKTTTFLLTLFAAGQAFAQEGTLFNVVADRFEEPPIINYQEVPQDYEVGIYDFTTFENVDQSEERMTPSGRASGASAMWAIAPVHFDDADTLTSMTFWGTDTTSEGGMVAELRKKDLRTNEIEIVEVVKTFTTTAPLIADLSGRTMWDLYTGRYPHAFEHYYWPTEWQILHPDREVKVEFEHRIDPTATYYVYLYTVGQVESERVCFWSLSFTSN